MYSKEVYELIIDDKEETYSDEERLQRALSEGKKNEMTKNKNSC